MDYPETLLEEYENTLEELARVQERLNAMKRWYEAKGNLYISREDFYILTGIKTYDKKEAHDGDTV